ncbi:glycosyl hydrolase family 18 protein [Sphingobacterium sp. SGL-16]|uniref:glycosyl hydrolase family 18 protein n=1 Tax=Sphingobacterium sp. SGL-16 TaxID=2710883 RepID=UPI0013EA6E68|nr:glycosyl hydrolase family 18 protein [Sphingobacterium sp. SGL-16]NGM72442.1 chitinase [Sphingobacterium sp. SGL-16]
MKKLIILCIASLSILSSCQKEVIWVPDGYGASTVEKPSGEYMADKSFKRISYIYHNTNLANLDSAKLKYVTHLHFAFLNPKEDGTLQTLTNHANFEALNKLAKDNNVKTAISIQGNELMFRTIAANEQTRKKLVKSLVDFAVRYNLDGIDLDWEYPRANYGSDVTFEVFVQELSSELHSWHKYLSMAVTAGLYAGPVKDGITAGAIEAVDFVNLMAYDGIGTDTAEPNHHSSYGMANRVIDIWLNDKLVPKEKIILGVPLYGKNADNTSMTYTALLAAGANPNLDVFSVSGVNYYYNGLATIKQKTELAKSKGNGVMFWEYSQDAKGENSLLKASFDASR